MKSPRSRFLLLLALILACGTALFGADSRKKLVMLIAEPEYDTARTLPEFAAAHLAKDFRVTIISGSPDAGQTSFDRLDELAGADVLLVSVRRRTPPKAQLEAIRRFIASGKPVVGIRTASHAFALGRGQTLTEGNAEWAQFDAEVIGGNYSNHHGKGPPTKVVATSGTKHPILAGVKLPFESESTLYRNTPLKPGAEALLTGSIPDKAPEPVAWTFTRPGGGRTFYTSLGSPSDFKNPSFVTLLRNGLLWAAR